MSSRKRDPGEMLGGAKADMNALAPPSSRLVATAPPPPNAAVEPLVLPATPIAEAEAVLSMAAFSSAMIEMSPVALTGCAALPEPRMNAFTSLSTLLRLMLKPTVTEKLEPVPSPTASVGASTSESMCESCVARRVSPPPSEETTLASC